LGKGDKLPREMCGGPAVAQKYKVHQNAPLKIYKKNSFQWGPARMFSRVPLWLSTSLPISTSNNFVDAIKDVTVRPNRQSMKNNNETEKKVA